MIQDPDKLSRRERQVMDIVYARGQAAVSDVMSAMDDPPSYSAVRALMGVLVRKGHLKHRQDGLRYVYSATRPRKLAARSALQRTVRTFFDGSAEQAVAALIDMAALETNPEQLQRLAELIEQARHRGR
jgi:BlaI family transcriptional regulator, penicillinase repressor